MITIKTGKGIVKRAIRNICLLPIQDNCSSSTEITAERLEAYPKDKLCEGPSTIDSLKVNFRPQTFMITL